MFEMTLCASDDSLDEHRGQVRTIGQAPCEDVAVVNSVLTADCAVAIDPISDSVRIESTYTSMAALSEDLDTPISAERNHCGDSGRLSLNSSSLYYGQQDSGEPVVIKLEEGSVDLNDSSDDISVISSSVREVFIAPCYIPLKRLDPEIIKGIEIITAEGTNCLETLRELPVQDCHTALHSVCMPRRVDPAIHQGYALNYAQKSSAASLYLPAAVQEADSYDCYTCQDIGIAGEGTVEASMTVSEVSMAASAPIPSGTPHPPVLVELEVADSTNAPPSCSSKLVLNNSKVASQSQHKESLSPIVSNSLTNLVPLFLCILFFFWHALYICVLPCVGDEACFSPSDSSLK